MFKCVSALIAAAGMLRRLPPGLPVKVEPGETVPSLRDEADKLLSSEFQEDINLIYSRLPDNKQLLTLSATYPAYMATYAARYMRSPTFVRLNAVDPSLRGIKQYCMAVANESAAKEASSQSSQEATSAAAFERKYGIKVTYWRGDSQAGGLKLAMEHKAGRTQADVWSTASGIGALIDGGLIERFAIENASALGPAFRDPSRAAGRRCLRARPPRRRGCRGAAAA